MKRLTPALGGAILALALMVWAADLRKPAAEEAGSASPPASACPNAAAAFTDPLSAPHWNGWGVDPAQSRFQPAAMAGLAAADVPRLRLKWAFGFPGATFAFAQPTVIGGRVFIGSQAGKVYSLDASTGCTYWEFDAGALVRAAITLGPTPAGWTAYVGDRRGNLHAVDAVTGKALWTTQVDDHPAARITGAPMLVGIRCTCRSRPKRRWPQSEIFPRFRGSVSALGIDRKMLGKSYPGRGAAARAMTAPACADGTVRRRGVVIRLSTRQRACCTSPPATITRTRRPACRMPSWRSTLHPGSWRGRGRSRPATPSTWRVRRWARTAPRPGGRISISARRRSWSALRMENAR